MDQATDDFALESIVNLHGIAAEMFVPIPIERLRIGDGATQAVLSVSIRGMHGSAEEERRLRLYWSPSSVPQQRLGVQDAVVTE